MRDLKRLATVLDVPERRAAFVAELALPPAWSATTARSSPSWAPTPAYDEWQQQPGRRPLGGRSPGPGSSPPAPRTSSAPRPPGASGTVNALGPDAQLAAGPRPAAGRARPARAAATTGWPPSGRRRRGACAGAARAGCPARLDTVVGRGPRGGRVARASPAAARCPAPGRALLADATSPPSWPPPCTRTCPTPVEHVLLQADLTAIAPGPLEGGLAQFMRLVADVESRGGATVYRFTPDSVRRCLDAGWSVDQVLGALTDASHTPVPQPLDYLVRDVARRHGQARVGAMRGLHPLRRRGHPRARCSPTARCRRSSCAASPRPSSCRRWPPTRSWTSCGRTASRRPPRPPTAGSSVPAAGQPPHAAAAPPPAPVTAQAVDDELAHHPGRCAARRARRPRHTSASRWRAAPGPSLPSTDPTTTLAVLREAAADRQARLAGLLRRGRAGRSACSSTPSGSRAAGCTARRTGPRAPCRSTG